MAATYSASGTVHEYTDHICTQVIRWWCLKVHPPTPQKDFSILTKASQHVRECFLKTQFF